MSVHSLKLFFGPFSERTKDRSLLAGFTGTQRTLSSRDLQFSSVKSRNYLNIQDLLNSKS